MSRCGRRRVSTKTSGDSPTAGSMAEAVRPPRRAKAKASRTKTKEKKKYETLQREEPAEVSLPKTSRELEVPTPACEFKEDHLKVLTESQLQNDASGQNESEMFEVPLTSLTISNEEKLRTGKKAKKP